MKVFIEASGSLVSGCLIKSIKEAGMEVVASDITNNNAGGLLADEYIKLPDMSDNNLWKIVKDYLIDEEIDWVIPTFDEMLLGWSKREKDFNAEGIKILISPSLTIDTFIDKWNTYNAFIQSGLPAPKASLEKKYPMVKPRKGRGSQGITFTDEIDVNMEDKISQEVVEGTELTVDCFFDRDGTPIYIVPRIRLKVIDGKSVNAQTIQHKKVEQHIREMAKKYHFIGPINIQCFINNEDIWFIEVNPRVGGGMALGWAATENWFDLWFNKIIQGKSFQPKPIQYGLQMYRYYAEIFNQINEIQSHTI
jgi:carbamoyl-phosphate synthase large subunit